MSITALTIPLIVDTICHHLSLPNLRICRQVCRTWSTLFKAHPWRVTQLSSTTPLYPDDLSTLIRNKSWIQSLTVSSVHLDKLSHVHSHSLQALVLYDDTYTHGLRTYEKIPVCVDTIVTLIARNANLMSLEIDLNLHNYRSKRLTPSLLLAIAKHPSLVKLEWSVPDQVRCHYFGRALLYVCHHRSMKELYLKRRHSPSDYEYEDWGGWPFSLDRYKCTSLDLAQDDSLEYMNLQAKFNASTPLDQLGGPFAFKKLFLDAGFDGYDWSSHTPFNDVIRMCPYLVDVCVHAYWTTHITTIDLLAERCPDLRGLDFSMSGKNPTANDLSLFSQLQRIRFMDYMPDFQLSRIFNATLSQRKSLEVIAIGLQYISAPDAVQIIKTFPNLRVLDLGCLRIFVHDLSSEDSQTGCLQSRADLQSLDIVVKEWAPYSVTMYTEMDFWWSAWNEAQQFMDSFVRFYRQWSGQPPLRPVHMRFMYPLKHFMRVTEAMMYSNVVEDGPEDHRPMTIEDVQRLACYIRDWTMSPFTIDERCPGLVLGSWGWEEEEEDFDQAYELSKSRNRHHTLRYKKRSPFRRPFKK